MSNTLYKLVVAQAVTQMPTDRLVELKEKWSIALELIALELEQRQAMGTMSGPVIDIPMEAIEEVIINEPGGSPR